MKTKLNFKIDIFISKTRLVFTKLRNTFIEITILYYFDLKFYIQIKLDIFANIINKILYYLTTIYDIIDQTTYKSI